MDNNFRPYIPLLPRYFGGVGLFHSLKKNSVRLFISCIKIIQNKSSNIFLYIDNHPFIYVENRNYIFLMLVEHLDLNYIVKSCIIII